jgi:hypothetical protein
MSLRGPVVSRLSLSRFNWVLGPAFLTALCGVLLWSYYPIGFFHDDAIYWLMGQAFRHGSNVLAGSPLGAPPVNYQWGYPLILALFSVGQLFFLGKALSLSLVILSVIIGCQHLKSLVGIPLGWSIAFFWASQPILARYSTSLMSEPLYLFILTVSVALYLSQDRKWDMIVPILAGYTCWIRPTGFLLPLVLVIDGSLRRRWGMVVSLIICLLFFQGSQTLLSLSRGVGPNFFYTAWLSNLSGANVFSIWSLLLENILKYGNMIFFLSIVPLGHWASWLQGSEVVLFIGKALMCLFCLIGAARAWRIGGRVWVLLLAFHLGVLIFWPQEDPRYLFPLLLPFSLFWGLGCAFLVGMIGARWLLAVGVLLCVCVTANAVTRQWEGGGPVLPSQASYSWCRDHLKGNPIIACRYPYSAYLSTGVRGASFLRTYDPESLFGPVAKRRSDPHSHKRKSARGRVFPNPKHKRMGIDR